MAEPLDLDAIEARAEAASPGPWGRMGATAEFNVRALADVPALVAELRAARRERDEARAMARILAVAHRGAVARGVLDHGSAPPDAVVAAALAYPRFGAEKETT